MENFTKVVRLGCQERVGYTFCKIQFKDKRLSITGVEGPLVNGDARGSCGQIVMSLKASDITPAPGWTTQLIKEFLCVWDRWHLNDLRAGSPPQEDWVRSNVPKGTYKYEQVCKHLAEAGLNPDADGYKYGHAWKFETVPEGVLEFLKGLPDTDITPAWV